MRNTPYVKRYDENGNLLNPFKRAVISPNHNRRERRKQEREMRKLFNSGKGGNNRKAKRSDGTIQRIKNHLRHVINSLTPKGQTKVKHAPIY